VTRVISSCWYRRTDGGRDPVAKGNFMPCFWAERERAESAEENAAM